MGFWGLIELCVGRDCKEACSCNNTVNVYLSIPCDTDPCTLANATGIFKDRNCSDPVTPGFYSDGTDCVEWDGSSILSISPC